MDIEVEGIVDVLVGGAERDPDRLEHPPYAEQLEGVATETIGADDPDLGETTGASVTDERTTTRSLLQRDGSRDTIVLVMLEDQNIRLGTQTAGQGGALVADGMAVTLLVGGDAGVGGYGANGLGKTTSSGRGVEAGCMNAPKARRGQGGSAFCW